MSKSMGFCLGPLVCWD